MNTITFSLKEKISFIKNNIRSSLTIVPFYRVKDLMTEMNRCEELHRN